ncbi:DNA-binding response regulator [hydrothermal vent metagenome]|uniref:DNA-binding response regulator n=1 Tax=hydrothermal vent metagenome TaxID=652676 RepID=A0A1W1CGH6_9ZZZZ
MSANILLLEDDKLFNETLQDFLEEEGYNLSYALDPYSALDLTYEKNFDLYIFDVNLPYESGFDLLKKLRDSGDTTPAIFITSRNDKKSLRDGFESGADDYLKKPIDLDELLLRIEAILRRLVRSDRVTIGEYTLDIKKSKLYLDNVPVEIPKKVITLLRLFVSAHGEVVLLDEIKDKLWAVGEEASDGSLRVYITQLKKLFPNSIKNIRGVGYSFSILDKKA